MRDAIPLHYLQRCFRGCDYFFIVRLLTKHRQIIDIGQFPIPANNKDSTAKITSLLDEQTILLTKFGFDHIGYEFHPVHTCGAAPALLRKRKVSADRVDHNIFAEIGGFLVKPPGFDVTRFRIDRWDSAQDNYFTPRLLKRVHSPPSWNNRSKFRRGISHL